MKTPSTLMKWVLLLCNYYIAMLSLKAQVPSFSQIYVTSTIDSLQKTLATKKGIAKFSTLLSLEKSLIYWETGSNQAYLDEIKKELPNYPKAQGHYWYFNSRQERLKTNLDKAFAYAKAAYEQYKIQDDSTGMVTALSNMGVIILERDERNSPDKPHFGHQYLNEAMALSRHSSNPELQILYTYALSRYVGWNSLKKNENRILPQIMKGISLTDKYPQYIYYKIHLLNLLGLLCDSKGQYKKAQAYTLDIIDIFNQHRRTVPVVFLYNLGFYYEMQQNYDNALQSYQLAFKMAHRKDQRSVRFLWQISAGIHASLVGLKKYKDAATWADSIYNYGEEFGAENLKTKFQETVVNYELEKKEARNKLLEQEKKLTETQNRLYLGLGIITTLALCATVSFIYRLRSVNKKLQSAFSEILQHNQARDYFFGVIAHDLRQPFSSFQNMAELINFYLSTHRYTELEKVSESIDQMGKRIRLLLDNLLNWALTQREDVPYYPERIHFAEKIRHVVELYQLVAQHQNVSIHVACAENLMVHMDPQACDLIIRNLVDNALKNSSVGGEITLKASLEDEKGMEQVRLTIEDTGKGMIPEKLAIVEEILHHPDLNSTHRRGMGLILVGRFIKRNLMTIRVNSVLNKGTSFTMTIPV